MNRKYHVKLSVEERKSIQERMNHEETSARGEIMLDDADDRG